MHTRGELCLWMWCLWEPHVSFGPRVLVGVGGVGHGAEFALFLVVVLHILSLGVALLVMVLSGLYLVMCSRITPFNCGACLIISHVLPLAVATKGEDK